jgi:tRNA(Ile)-lysidine synthase
MPHSRVFDTKEGEITLWRPLLNQNRKDLEAYAKEHKLKWIEDPSNQDVQYRRNAIRKTIIPALEKIQPEAIANLARSAGLLGEAQALLDRLASQDGKTIILKDGLQLMPLLELAKKDLPAANNVLRYWLKVHSLTMPSQERLAAWWSDLNTVKAGAQLEWAHDEKSIRLWRGILQIENVNTGAWVFKTIPSASKTPGLPSQLIKEAQKNGLITQQDRSGSEKIQIKANTPRKSLKNLFQEGNIPPWQRNAPLLYINGDLIAVAGVGVSYPHLVHSGPRVRPEWVQNPVK